MKKIVLFCAAVYFLLSGFSDGDKTVTDFSLKNVDGRIISLKDYSDAKGFIIVFTSNGCPFAKLYPQRMNELNLKYTPLGIPLIAINSSDTLQFDENSFTQMVLKSKEGNFNFPYLSDAEQVAAKNFTAKKTPQAFVIWKENNNWVVKYSGAIDDNGAEPQKVQNKFVENAVNELLEGKEVTVKETKSVGCSIIYKK